MKNLATKVPGSVCFFVFSPPFELWPRLVFPSLTPCYQNPIRVALESRTLGHARRPKRHPPPPPVVVGLPSAECRSAKGVETGCEGGLHTWLNFWPALNAFVPTIEQRRVLAFCLAAAVAAASPFLKEKKKRHWQICVANNRVACLAKLLLPQRNRVGDGEKTRFTTKRVFHDDFYGATCTQISAVYQNTHTALFATRLTARKHLKRLERALELSDYYLYVVLTFGWISSSWFTWLRNFSHSKGESKAAK